jgi:hypothetical protein
MIEITDELLVKAAVFLAHDGGSPGFLGRITEAVDGDVIAVSQAIDRALTAQTRAGQASFQLEPGDLQVETTSAGASLTACALESADGRMAATVRLVDARHRPVEGAVLQVSSHAESQHAESQTVVTNASGWVQADMAAGRLRITLGQSDPGQRASTGLVSPPDTIELPRRRHRNEYELAADTSGVAETDDPSRWRVVAGGVEFLCLERKGGYDLTLLIAGVTADFTHKAIGTYGVGFRTRDRRKQTRGWIVPLAPSPLGLTGSLYGTDEHEIVGKSIDVSSTEQLLVTFGGQLDQVIRRSVQHADTLSVWAAVYRRLPPGDHRAALEAALAKRESAQ